MEGHPVFAVLPADHSDADSVGILYTFGAGAFTTLFPVFGKKMLALGPVEVGYLWSWLGIGLFLVSLALVPLTQWDARRRLQVVSRSPA